MAEDFLTELFSGLARDLVMARLVKEVSVPAPGAGNDWLITVPGGVLWEVLSVQEIFTTSAVVANRQPSLTFLDSDGIRIARIGPSGSVAASGSSQISFLAGLGATISVSHNQSPLPTPPIPYPSGTVIGSVTGNFDAADAYTKIVLMIREWDVTSIMQEVEELDEQFQAYISRRA